MNDTEFEAWLASRLGSAPSPEPSPRLVARVHEGRRPIGALTRKPIPTRPGWLPAGRRGFAGLAGLAACVALAGALLLGISARTSPSSGAINRPSSGPTTTPSASTPPSTSPTPGATATAIEATVAARVTSCQDPLGWDYTVWGNDLFVACNEVDLSNPNAGPGGAYVARVDLTTNQVTATYRYKTEMTYIEALAVLDGSLWFDGTFGSACVAPCKGFRRLERFDVASGKNTFDVPDAQLQGSGYGYIWVRDGTGIAAGTRENLLRKLDPTTGHEMGRIPFDMDGVQFACGSLWGVTRSGWATDDPITTAARLDPASGRILDQFTVPGGLGAIQPVGSECWASVMPYGADLYAASYADHFVRIGDAGIEDSSPVFALDDHGGSTLVTYLDIQGGAFWLVSDDFYTSATLQRIDPSTWQPTGTVWQSGASGYQGDPFAIIDGSTWAYNDAGGISRLDIPVGSLLGCAPPGPFAPLVRTHA